MQISENFLIMINMMVVFSFFYSSFLAIMGWKRLKIRDEFQRKLLDKFASGEELAKYLGEGKGTKLFDSAMDEKISPTRDKIMSSLTKSVILACLGAGFFLVSNLYAVEESQAFGTMGIISVALGVGFGLATFISFTLSRKWGIINGDSNSHDVD